MQVEHDNTQVIFDWAPAYELVSSLRAFLGKSEHRTLDLGTEWVRAVKARLDPELSRSLSPGNFQNSHLLDVLIRDCPGDRSSNSFLEWLKCLRGGELYECLQPLVRDPRELEDLSAWRDSTHCLLSEWNNQYFSTIDPAILTGLERNRQDLEQETSALPPLQRLDIASNGIRLDPGKAPSTIVLVPQYHFRPWNIFSQFRGLDFVYYPCDAVPSAGGATPSRLVRLARALSDDSRLRLLRLLALKPRSFTELVRELGISKSTVHHHTVVLRAAGLIRVEVQDFGTRNSVYALRRETVEALSGILDAYLQPTSQESEGS